MNVSRSHDLRTGGFGLIEVVVASAILAGVLFGVSFFFQQAVKMSRDATYLVQANFLINEGIEAVKLMRDNGWENISGLTPGIDYSLEFNGSSWATTTTSTYIDGLFDRRFIVEDVLRDGNNDIASVGVNDPNTKKITVTVSWRNGSATTSKSVATYITNLFDL